MDARFHATVFLARTYSPADITDRETWATTSEGMGRSSAIQYGANGWVYAARLIWKSPSPA